VKKKRMANIYKNYKQNVINGVLLLIITALIGAVTAYLGVDITILLMSGIMGVIFFLARPFQGLLLFIFLLPSEVLIISTSFGSVHRYLGMAITFVWLIQLMVSRRSFIFRKRSLFYLAFFALSWFSLLWASMPYLGFQYAITYIQLAFLLIIMLDQINSLTRMKQIIVSLAAGGILSVVIFYLFGSFDQFGRFSPVSVGGPGLATYGYPLAFSVTILGALAILSKGKLRVTVFLGFIVSLFPLIGTGLRGALLAMVTGLGAIGYFLKSKKRHVFINTMLIVLIFFGSIFLLVEFSILPPNLIRHLTISDMISSGGSNRLKIWQIALDVSTQNRILGLGLNQFGNYVYGQGLYISAVSVHNDYLSTLVNLGVVGAFVLILAELITVIYLIKIRQYVQSKDIAWYGVLVALIFSSIVAQNFIDALVYKYIWVIRAIVIAGSYRGMWLDETEDL
jgi:hypothetical protein